MTSRPSLSPTRMPFRALFAALAITTLAAAGANAATPAAAVRPAGGTLLQPTRDVRTLPSLKDLIGARPANAIVSQSDTFLLRGEGFDDLAGNCDPRGWVGEDRSTTVWAHRSDRFLVNQQFAWGLHASGLVDNVTGRVPTTRILDPTGVCVTDSGALVFDDAGGGGPHRLLAAYPSGVMRVYGVLASGFVSARNLAFDAATGTVVFADGNLTSHILRYTGDGGVGTPLAGGGTVVQDTTAFAAKFQAYQLAVDQSGNIYFSDPSNSRVRMLRIDGRIVTVAGTGSNGFSGDGGPATSAQLNGPGGIALAHHDSVLYIADYTNARIRRVDLVTGIITTAYGNGSTQTVLGNRLAAVGDDLYIIDGGAATILRLSAGVLTRVAGQGLPFGPASGAALGAQQRLVGPNAIWPDGSGGVVFSDVSLNLVFDLHANGTLSVAAGIPYAMQMGSNALWFGADSTSDPGEVAGWVQPVGYGNYWSQRLVSPAFSRAGHPNSVLSFDLWLDYGEQEGGLGDASGNNHYLAVQLLDSSGWWATLNVMSDAGGSVSFSASHLVGRGFAHVTVPLDSLGNEAILTGATTRLRVLVQNQGTGSNEDGQASSVASAAVLDNITLRDAGGNVVPALDLEAPGLGTWSLSAMNGASRSSFVAFSNRDVPFPLTFVDLRKNFASGDPSCAWTFLSPGDSVLGGVTARLTSPWFAPAPGDTQLLVTFSGKLATISQGRVLSVILRGKNSGDIHPRVYNYSAFSYQSGTYGNDAEAPYVNQKVVKFPNDFSYPQVPTDSVQIVFDILDANEDQDPITWPPFIATGPTAQRLPYLDDIHVYQLGVDQDHDGVADAGDVCQTVCAAGQDADGDGCVDPTATMRHVESWAADWLPLHYRISLAGDPRIGDGSDLTAIANGFAAWTSVPGAQLQLIRDPDSPLTDATAYDGVGLVTFQDADYQFPANVLAVTPTLSATRRTTFNDQIVLPGQIVDSDLIFNPASNFSTPSYHNGQNGFYDLQGIVTHEAGHFLGLSHSGVTRSTMFFVLQPGTGARSLESDDMAAIAAAYPAATIGTSYATITGTVTNGALSQPLPGALVSAVVLDGGGAPQDTVASDYTTEDGTYALRRLPAGRYGVRITPLDGEAVPYGLTPEYISDRVAAIAVTNFQPEWWSIPESDRDDPTVIGSMDLIAGQTAAGVNVISNVDTLPPYVLSVRPPRDSVGVRIDTPILVNFSERINGATLNGSFRLHAVDSTSTLGGDGLLLNGGRSFIFTPNPALRFNTQYQLDFTTGLADLQGVHLAAKDSTRFTTEQQPALAITDIVPRQAAPGSFITILGAGFGGSVLPDSVEFAAAPGCLGPVYIVPTSVTPTSITLRIPPSWACTTQVRVRKSQISNPFVLFVLPPTPAAAPAAVADYQLGFAPTDVALSPDGAYAFAVGSGGWASVDLGSGQIRTEAIGDARHLAVSPDGRQAYVTRPSSHDVVRVDADPLSGTFGQIRAITPVGDPGTPDGIAFGPTGQQVLVTDEAGGVIYTLNSDSSSAMRDSVTAELRDSVAVMTGGICVHPANTQIFYTTANLGSRGFRKTAQVFATYNSGTSGGGVAVNPAGDEVAYAGAGSSASQLLWSTLNGTVVTGGGAVSLGGSVRDVAVNSQGTAALCVNSSLNQLQLVGLNPALLSQYHIKIGEVGTGVAPVAVSTSLDGSVVGVANFGSRTLSIYRTGGSTGLVRILPAVARPGDLVTVEGSGGRFGAGSTVDIGGGAIPITRLAPGRSSFSFRVPALTQRDASLSVNDSTGGRTLALPFQVVDPNPGVAPVSLGLNMVFPPLACTGVDAGAYDHLRVSPDGTMLADLHASDFFSCAVRLDLFDIGSGRPKFYGKPLAWAPLIGAGQQLLDAAFTNDGGQLWTSYNNFLAVFDSDPASPSFGSQLNRWDAGSNAVVADPLGRGMLTAHADSVYYFTDPSEFTSGPATMVPGTGIVAPYAIAVTPDGRYALVAGYGSGTNSAVAFVDLDARITVANAPVHVVGVSTSGMFDAFSVAVTTNGKRAFVKYPDATIGIYNVDATAGAIGAELYFGLPLGAQPLGRVVPAGNGTGVLIPGRGSSQVFMLDGATIPPTVTSGSVGSPVFNLATSPDGRRLFTAYKTDSFMVVREFNLASVTGASLVAGGNQTGAPGATLPTPVRVRVTGPGNVPVAGVVARFSLGLPFSPLGLLDNDSTTVFHITDANGEAEAVWRLSNTLGRDTLVVTLLGTGQPAIIVDARVGDLSSTPPTIVAFGPANGAANLNAGSAVSVKFSKGMNPGSATAGVKLFANGNPVTGSTTLQLNQTYVLIQPDQLLPFAARCSLDVQTGVLDVNGLPLAAGAFSVFTVQQPPTLALTSINPPAGSTGIPVVIDGVGFSTVPAQNSVLFNGTPAVVSSATATSIVATVPLTATSGTVTVQVGAGSATLNYTVLTGGGVGGSVANIGVTQGSRKIAVTSDGKRAYVTNPGSNTVQALDVANLTTLADITVGLQPSGIGLVNDTRAYVANQGSDDVSVIDIDPSSPDYHKVVAIIPVGDEPVDLAVTALGPEVLVVNHSSKTVSFIDANPGNGTYNQVITQTNTGSRGGGGIAITPDGGRAYVITDAGDLIEIDLHTNAVITQSNTGSRGGSGVAITPDGTLALVLLNDGTLLVIDIVPNSSNHNGVITQTNTGSKGGGGVAISPDGGRAYVTSADGNVTLVFTITASNGAGQIVIVPGPAVTLTLESTIAVGQAPLGVVVDPGGKYVLVVNSGSGTVTLIGSPNSLPPVPATFDFNPNTLNLKSNGKWVTGFIEPSDPFTAQQIVVSSIRLNGVVAVDSSGPVAIGDHDGNGKQDLAVKFSRNAVSLILPSGDKVPVTVTGIVDTRTFIATDSIKVKLGKVTAPVANSIVPPGHATTVRWETPSGIQVQWVAVLHSFDRGETWTLDATHQPNTGQYQWTAPTQQGDSVKVAVMQVESADTSGTLVEGTLGVSGFFRIFGPTDVEPAPAVLSFLPAHPNPASGGVRMRFGLPRRTDVTLELYDLMGRRVTTLAAGEHEAGWHDVAWTGRSRDGSVAHAGVYFVRFRAEGREFKQRLVWLR